MNEAQVERYAAMWTTDVQRYGIVEFEPGRLDGCLVFDLEAGAPIAMDDDPEIVARIIQKMRDAGARRLTPVEVKPK